MTEIIIHDNSIKDEEKTKIIDVFSKIENRLSNGKNNIIHICMIVSAFKQ